MPAKILHTQKAITPALLAAVYERPWNIEGGAWRSIHSAIQNAKNLSILDFYTPRPETTLDDNGVMTVHVSGVLGNHAPIAETLGDTDYRSLQEDFENASQEAAGVLLVVDSPGGQATGNIETALMFSDLSIPTVAFCEGMSCSAAYAISVGADEIVATPSSLVGSIGCIIPFVDESKLWEDHLGIKADYITSGDLKGAGFPPSLSDAQRGHLQEIVDDLFAEFRSHVLRFRNISDDAMRGQSVVGTRALDMNLIDKTGDHQVAYDTLLERMGR